MSTIWSSRARKRSFCPLSRRSFGRIANHSRRLSSDRESRLGARLNLQVAARSTDQAGKIEYFKIPANAQNQDTSEFFTDDRLDVIGRTSGLQRLAPHAPYRSAVSTVIEAP